MKPFDYNKYLNNNPLLKEAAKENKLGPAIDLKKLSKVMNGIVDEDGDKLLDDGEISDVLDVLRNLPILLRKLDGDEDESMEAAEELMRCQVSFITNLPKNKQKLYKPLDDGITYIASAGDEYNSKWALKGYKMISDFLNKM
jgi:hypothetical protein